MMRNDSFPQDEKPGDKMGDEPCWFCKRRDSEAVCTLEVPMYGNVEGSAKTAQFSTVRLKVPRCAVCKKTHAKVNAIFTTGISVGLTVWVLLILVFRVHEILYALGKQLGLSEVHAFPSNPGQLLFVVIFYGFPYLFPMFVAVMIVGLAFDRFSKRLLAKNGIIREDSVDQFPIIAEHISKGWKKGEKP